MCILQFHTNVNIWGLPLRFDIVYYLFPMWHVCSNKFQFSFVVVSWLLFGWVCLVWFFSNMYSIYLVRNHLFHLILTMALPVGSNCWNYQQTFVKIWRLNSYLLPYVFWCEVGLDHHSYIPPRDISIYSLSWQVILVIVVDCVDHLRIGSCVKFVLFIAFFVSCKDHIFLLVVFSVVNKIWRVMIPCECILYSNANI